MTDLTEIIGDLIATRKEGHAFRILFIGHRNSTLMLKTFHPSEGYQCQKRR